MDITVISDLHGFYPKLEGGDLLIVAGDLTARDQINQYVEFYIWLDKQAYKYKIFIAGNHDNEIQKGLDYEFANENIYYLEDSSVEIEGLKIWGSPCTKTFPGMNPHCKAFTCDTEEELAEKWAKIPEDTDILITHSPPFGILDSIPVKDGSLFHVGSKSLRMGMGKYKPRLWIVGHIHEGYGEFKDRTLSGDEYHIVNASHVNERYQPVNKPIRIIL